MKEGQRLWTRDELILAINLYCNIDFGKMHSGNADVKNLAQLIDRKPGAVARKLGNFASFDPSLKKRGVGGLPNSSKLDAEVWNQFYNNWDETLIESEKLLAKKKGTTIEILNNVDTSDLNKVGFNKQRLVSTRVNQCIFRKMILATYDNKCCITGIGNIELLVASHIVGWQKDEKNRLNPMNGLCLNALHDKAFDNHLITISAEDYTLKVSSKFKGKNPPKSVIENFISLENKCIELPDKFLPSKELLKIHNGEFKA